MTDSLTRREFATGTAAAGLALALSAPPVRADKAAGANERIRLAFIGVGNRGSQLLEAFARHQDAQFVAFCDVYQPYLARAKARYPQVQDAYEDFRKLLERKDIDAVVIATPDHWHALQTIAACNAGKDVYVEKPLSVTIHEGRKMVEAARRNQRVVQVGTHRRASEVYARLHQLVAAGGIGKVSVARAYRLSNMAPGGIGRRQPSSPPPGLNWDLWLGPRPERPFQDNIAPYKFRWWNLYSSQMANWGVHYCDAIRWVLDELAPKSVCAIGGRYAVDDDRTVPDTAEAVFEFASGRLAIFGQYEASGAPALLQGEIELRGTQGTAYVSEAGYHIVPEIGGQFAASQPRMKPIDFRRSGKPEDGAVGMARDFLDCMRSRKLPAADVEIGHRSTSFSLLANISLATGRRLYWDADRERFLGDPEADALLHYEYRQPWRLE